MINKKKKVGDIKCFKESHLLPSHRFAFFNISLEKSILNCMPLSDIKQCTTIYVCVNPQCDQFLFCILHKFQGNPAHELNLKDPKDLYLTYMMLILGIIINSNTHCDIQTVYLNNQNLIWLFICTYEFSNTKHRKIMMQWSLFKVTTITKKYQTSKNYGYDIQFHNQI